jgi:membrane protease YdiL (CAAX protease family)
MLTWKHSVSRFILTLTIAPLIRITSLLLPLANFPEIYYWYLIVGVPLFAAAITALRTMRFSRKDVGLEIKRLPIQIPVILTGLSLGYIEYRILRPSAFLSGQNFNLRELWLPALSLIICTGFAQELIFRGVMQKMAVKQMGTWGGITYVAAIFAVLHIGYQSVPNLVFVFIVALFFGLVTLHTGSIIGVALAYGLTNIILFLTMPVGVNPFSAIFNLINALVVR